MFIVVNREVLPEEKGLAQPGPEPDAYGPNERRIVEVARAVAGGGVAGVVSHKCDKRDARASNGALERTIKTT